MIGANTNLPKEVVALVHHVELNSAGWWERTIQRLVMAAVWLSGKPLRKDEINAYLRDQFKLDLSTPKLDSALGHLESDTLLVPVGDGAYRIPDSQQTKLDAEVLEAEVVAKNAREFFCATLSDLGSALNPDQVWKCFEKHFLIPLVNEIGDNSRKFLSGEPLDSKEDFVLAFLQCFDARDRGKLRKLVTTFLDPSRKDVRSYLGRMLHARFCVEAGGMSEETVRRLASTRSRQLHYRIFLDTNILFSLLKLHDNPANDAANELADLIAKLKNNPEVKLVVAPRTIKEAKTALDAARIQLQGIAVGKHFNKAVLSSRYVSGIVQQYFIEQGKRGGLLSADEWFNPYLNSFTEMARAKGVELYNDSMEDYSMHQKVIDDIDMVMQFEEKNLEEWKRKSYEKLAHDIILWHYVNDKRSKAFIEAPMDAEDWILTLDGRLIGFDEMRHRRLVSKVPSCIHPTTMVQMLQFWLPRSAEFEEAMLSSLRLPFLYQEFDGAAEKTTLKILRAMGRFHLGDDVTEEAITNVLVNAELRKRLQKPHPEEEEAALVRDVLIEEMRTELNHAKERAEKAEAEAKAHARSKNEIVGQLGTEKERAVAETRREMQETMERLERERISEHQRQLDTAKGREELETIRANAAEEQLRVQRISNEGFRTELDQLKDELLKGKAARSYFGLLFVVLLVSGLSAWTVIKRIPELAEIFELWPCMLLVGGIVFVVLHFIIEQYAAKDEQMKGLWMYRQLKKFGKWLFLVFLVGVLINIYSNRVQKNMDNVPPVNVDSVHNS